MLPFDKYMDIGLSKENPTDTYLIPFYSIPLLHLRIEDWENKKKELFKIFDNVSKDSKVFKVIEDDPYDVETDYHYNFNYETETQKSLNSENIEKIFEDELNFISEVFEIGISVGNVWFEKAKTQRFHSVHNHGVTGFSCVVFMKYSPEEHTPTTFINPITASFGALCPQNQQPPGIREGSMIVFPSFLNHYTEPNNSNVERIILSFNLCVEWNAEKFQ
jgi:hypothetical protein